MLCGCTGEAMALIGKVSQAQMLGPRAQQEDRILHLPFTNEVHGSGHLIGIMDGHGGAQAADLCVRAIPKIFNPCAESPEAELERLITALTDRTARIESGSTLSLALILERQRAVISATLGDSPLLVLDATRLICVGDIHNARSNPAERGAAIARGAVYKNTVDGYYLFDGRDPSMTYGLQTSRGLGDCQLQRILSRTPAISRHSLGAKSVVVVASDGALDPTQPYPAFFREAYTLVRMAGRRMHAREIVTSLAERELNDNASLVVWSAEPWWRRLW